MANVDAAGEVIECKDDLRKIQITERLQKREEERIRNIEQRKAVKAVKEDAVVVEETGKFFCKQFAQMHDEIEKRLNNVTSGGGSNYFDDLVLDLKKLQKFLTDSTRFLSSYELQKAQVSVNQLKTAIEDKRKEVEPKKKFAFKSDKKKATMQVTTESLVSLTDKNAADVKPSPTATTEVAFAQDFAQNENGFSARHDETLQMSSAEVDSKDVLLATLTDCRVQLRGAPSTIHMSALRDCTVLCGPTSGSVFIDDCQRCTFVVACHQLRVHRTTDTNFYLHVTSRAIIEDCSAVRFAPYNWTYEQLENDFRKSSLDQHRNNWNSIDDFNWLAADTPSPNWSVLDESHRVASWPENGK